MTDATSRRALLGACIALPVLIGTGASATSASCAIDPALLALFSEHAAAMDAARAIDAQHKPICEEACARVDALPHFEASYQGTYHPVTLTTERRADVGQAYNFVHMSRSKHANRFAQRPADYVQASRRIVAASMWRKRQEDRIMAPARALGQQSDEAWAAVNRIEARVEALPSRSLNDLVAKLEWLSEREIFGQNTLEERVLADLRILTGVAA